MFQCPAHRGLWLVPVERSSSGLGHQLEKMHGPDKSACQVKIYLRKTF